MQPKPQWLTEQIATLQASYGEVPPPWIIYPEEHPYSICWRMGGGETHIMGWTTWWPEQPWDRVRQLAYFQRWPPPPIWLEWVADAIWQLEPWEGEIDYTTYFKELEHYGLGSQADFAQAVDDPKWYRGE